MKLTEFPKLPADEEWDRLVSDANDYGLVLVQVSPRKYRIGERRYIRWKDHVVQWIYTDMEETFTWVGGLIEMERRITAWKARREAAKV